MSVPGLNPNASTDAGASVAGFIVFCRSGNTESSNFDHYRRAVFHPTIEQTRRLLGMEAGGPIPQHLKVSSFVDGAGPQLGALVSESLQSLEHELKIDTFKHNPARSATEQAADLCRVFRSLKAHLNEYEADKFPASVLLKTRLAASFKSFLKLCSTKLKKIIEFCAAVPMLVAKAASPEAAVHGFVENGMLDKNLLMALTFADVWEHAGFQSHHAMRNYFSRILIFCTKLSCAMAS